VCAVAAKFIKMDYDELFTCGTMEITQKPVANPNVVFTTEALRLLKGHASDDRDPLHMLGRNG